MQKCAWTYCLLDYETRWIKDWETDCRKDVDAILIERMTLWLTQAGAWLNECLAEWLIDCINEWMTAWLIDWVTDRLTEDGYWWLTGWLMEPVTDWHSWRTEWVSGLLAVWLMNECQIGWQSNEMNDWQTARLSVWVKDWLTFVTVWTTYWPSEWSPNRMN